MKNSVSRLVSGMTTQVEMLADLKETCKEAKDKGFLTDVEQEVINEYIESVGNPWGLIHKALKKMEESKKAESAKKTEDKPAKAEKKLEEETAQAGLSFLD